MKILQVNNYYGERSTGKLAADLHKGLLAAGHSSLVVYGRGRTSDEPGAIRLCPEWYAKLCSMAVRLTGATHGGCLLSTAKLIRLIRREKPDIVHLQCINEHFVNIYRLVAWLNRSGIQTVLTLHAEFMYTANCGHAFDCDQWKHGCQRCPRRYRATKSWFLDRTAHNWKKMHRAMAGFEKNCIVTAVSPWTAERAAQGDILKNMLIRTVLNGINTDVIHRVEHASLCPGKAIVNVTHNFTVDEENMKGGKYVVELARRMPDVTFFVIGRHGEVPQLPENIRLLGFVSDQQKMAEYYSAADLLVMVSQRETFSMPCAESLCCGTPVVGFKAGAPEQIAMEDYSTFVEYADVDGLEKALRQWLSAQPDRQKIAQEAEKIYSVNAMIHGFLEVYQACDWSRKN